jgi:hypothetical protein
MKEVEKEMIIQNIPELTSEVGLEGVNENSVEDLLQSHGESLTIDELRELAEQHIQSEFIVPDAEEEKTPARELSVEFLSSNINVIIQIMDPLIDNDALYVKAQCMFNESSLSLYICMYCSEFHKKFLYLCTCFCIFTYPQS